VNKQLSITLDIFIKLLFTHLFFLSILTLSRVAFFLYYNPLEEISLYFYDLVQAFILGFRIDLTVIGYIQALPTIVLIVAYYLKNDKVLLLIKTILVYYLFIMYMIATILIIANFGFYSYFKEHINILFFGLFDDDTKALIVTMWQNYNLPMMLGLFLFYTVFLFFIIKKIFKSKIFIFQTFFGIKISFVIFLILFLLNFLAIRGTLGMYPLGKMIPNVSTQEFINKIPQNGIRAFFDAYSARKKYLSRNYDLIKETGFKGKIEKAFEIHKGTTEIDKDNLLANITYKTPKIDEDYNVVVVMVESFGMPILNYHSESFNILGALQEHFDEDILLHNFISCANGTISNLQALLLNIPHRPNSFAFSQSIYKQTKFLHSPAFLYADAGYETSFIYGGDLSWRSLDSFVKHQGYTNVEGKINIYESLQVDQSNDYFHPWGIYDEFLYEHIFTKLLNSDKKQFIVALSTNNHPPYNLPKQYLPKSLSIDSISHLLTGDRGLATQRFLSFQYAANAVGEFLTKLKQSPLKDNTIVVITADDNTVDGIMKYEDNELFNSKNIPLYFYLPPKLRDLVTVDREVFGSHKDIFPTLYNLTLSETEFIAIGSDIFDTHTRKIGFNGSMILATNEEVIKISNLSQKTDNPNVNYYKASLAITQYLIEQMHSKNQESQNKK